MKLHDFAAFWELLYRFRGSTFTTYVCGSLYSYEDYLTSIWQWFPIHLAPIPSESKVLLVQFDDTYVHLSVCHIVDLEKYL